MTSQRAVLPLGTCEPGQAANPGELGHKLEFPLSAFGQC